MSKDYNNLEDLFDDLEDIVEEVLQDEVLKEAKNIMQENVVDTVYEPYDPVSYKRKGGSGGLADPKNMKGELKKGSSDPTLVFWNNRHNTEMAGGHSVDRYIVPIIEYGLDDEMFVMTKDKKTGEEKKKYLEPNSERVKGDWGNGWEERPFVKNTYRDIERRNADVKAMMNGLKSRGYDVDME